MSEGSDLLGGKKKKGGFHVRGIPEAYKRILSFCGMSAQQYMYISSSEPHQHVYVSMCCHIMTEIL